MTVFQGVDPISTVDWATLSRLVPEALLVIIVAYFAYLLIQLFIKYIEKRDEAFLSALQKQREDHTEQTKARDADWRKFLEDERRIADNAMREQISDMKEVARQLGALTVLLSEHDKRSVEHWGEIRGLIGKRATDTKN